MLNRTIGVLLLIAVPLSACTTQSSADRGARLNGAGSTFAYPLYSKWADAFSKTRTDVTVDYQSIGSGGGIGLVSDGRVDFGATDGPMTDQQMKSFADQRGCEVLHVPTALGAGVPLYNVPTVSAELNFTPKALAGIFLGTIKKWNDPELGLANPQVALPNTDIVVVHRSDVSGTTYIWTDYLSKVSDQWKATVGRSTSVAWPVGTPASGNQGVADLVGATPNSIGYVELTYAIRSKLPFGRVQNSAGRFVKAELWSVTAAAAEFEGAIPEDFRVSITNAPGENSYPISSFTWILVPTKIANPSKRAALVALLNWSLSDGQSFAENLSYARLPDAVVEKAKSAIARIQ